jgi:hypothetical protein
MADITLLSKVIRGLSRNVDISSNTLVVDNLKAKLGGSNNFTFNGTLTGNRTITVPDSNINLADLATNTTAIGNLQTLSGVAANATSLGSFTGNTIPDNYSVKQALQVVETTLEQAQADSIVTALIFG